MRQFNKPHNDTEWYYIEYYIGGKKTEFWADNEEEFDEHMGFIKRHANYNLIYSRPPKKWPDDFRGFGIKVKF